MYVAIFKYISFDEFIFKVVSELKTNIKRKARGLFLYKKGTGGGPQPKELTELEDTMYGLISKVTIEGASSVPEPGMEEVCKTVTDNSEEIETEV